MDIKLCECGCGQATSISTRTRPRFGNVKGQPVRFVRGHHGHGMTGTPEYMAYCNAKSRCTNSNDQHWKDYGGRGIQFLFTSFEQFFAEIGSRPEGKSLDRINNDGNYEVGNVRWATIEEQNINRRPRNRVTFL